MAFASLLTRAAQRWGDDAALIDAESGTRLSFSALAAACFGLGNELLRSLAPGDRVALLADAQIEYLLADYGIMAAGLVRVPLDPALTPSELAGQLKDAGAKCLLVSATRSSAAQTLRSLIAEADLAILSLEDTVARARPAAASMDALLLPPQSLASLNYTGGTTTTPKAVMLSHGNLRAILQNIVMARGTAPGEVMLNVRPIWPIAAVIVLAQLMAGGTVVLGGSFDPVRFVALLRQYRASSTSLVPTHLVRLLRDVPAEELRALDTLAAIDVGAAAIAPAVFQQALDSIGPKIGVLYGLTEASWSCYQPPGELLGAERQVLPARMVSAGRPVFGCELRIAPDNGEILIRGANVMQGYWKRPELTRDVLAEGWFHTGDIGQIDAAGYLSVTGRLKEIIRTGGKSVQPGEVEEALCEHPQIAEAVVVGIPDAEWGEIVAAVVVPASAGSLTVQAVAEHCAVMLSSHKRPKLIKLEAQLPRSHYGKVQRARVIAELVEYRRARSET